MKPMDLIELSVNFRNYEAYYYGNYGQSYFSHLLPTPITYTGVKTYEQYMRTRYTDKNK